MRDSLCIIDPVITANKRRWNNQTHGSDSGVSVHSDALPGESFESNPGDDAKYEKTEDDKFSVPIQEPSNCDNLVQSCSCLEKESYDAKEIEPEVIKQEEAIACLVTKHPVFVKDVPEVEDRLMKIEARDEVEEKEMTMKIVVDRREMPMDALYEESQTCCFVEDKHGSMHFDRLDNTSLTTDDEDDAIFEDGCRFIRMSQASPIRMHQMFQVEVEENPEEMSFGSLVRHGSTDKRERVETSLRVCSS